VGCALKVGDGGVVSHRRSSCAHLSYVVCKNESLKVRTKGEVGGTPGNLKGGSEVGETARRKCSEIEQVQMLLAGERQALKSFHACEEVVEILTGGRSRLKN